MTVYPFAQHTKAKHEIFTNGVRVLTTDNATVAAAKWAEVEASGQPATARAWSGDDYRDAKNRHGSGRAP
jgi:hypothetical protein